MATTPISSEPAAPPPPVVGTFVSTSVSQFVRPSAEVAAAWRQGVPRFPSERVNIETYLILKLLAPAESNLVQVEAWPEVIQILLQVEEHLVQRYLRSIDLHHAAQEATT